MADPASAPPRGKRVLAGLQPSGAAHIGNYFGSMRQMVALQEHNRGTYFIADLHSLNSIRDAAVRRRYTLDMALDYLAVGLDPAKVVLYRQSDLLEVCELAWVLTTLTPMGLLERCHAYKDKLEHGSKPDHGLFAYPVLMAADILIHRAQLVPVGLDQKQHIEVARDIAVKFNLTYREVFELPEPYILKEVAVVPGTDGQKMSKTYGNAIDVFAPEKQVRKQVMGIVTDSTPVEAPKDPDSSTLFQLYALFASPEERAEMAARFRAGGYGYGEAKKALLAKVLDYFGPARARRESLAKHPDAVEDVLLEGARRARETVASVMAEVRSAAGIGPI
jgi:tryptophanyl-tRNA synthetase